MSELVRAATALDSEVSALQPKAKMKVAGEPDGFDINRSVSYDAATTKWLLPILESLDDNRIESIDDNGKQTVITFVSDSRADHTDPFGLASVNEVLNA